MKQIITIITIAVVFTSCSSIKITSEKDGSVDFDQHKTLSYYGWAEESDKILNRFEKERIERAFGDEFKKRGFSLAERDGDIIVSLFIVVDQKKGLRRIQTIMVEVDHMAIMVAMDMALDGAGEWVILPPHIRNMTTM